MIVMMHGEHCVVHLTNYQIRNTPSDAKQVLKERKKSYLNADLISFVSCCFHL